jgi:UPF0271 protein
VTTAASIDLNCDVGEVSTGPGDAALLSLVTSAHVACGFHAGGPTMMRRTVEAAAAAGVVIGAHPSYADREGFGRRAIDVTPPQVADEVAYQVGALMGIAKTAGTSVRSVKAHGALYHRLSTDEACTEAVAVVVGELGDDLALVLAAGCRGLSVAASCGVRVVAEGFCDRGYSPDGSLAERSGPGGMVSDPAEAAARAVSLAVVGEVTAVDGSVLALDCDTVCIHGDAPGALAVAGAVREALDAAGVVLAPFATLR